MATARNLHPETATAWTVTLLYQDADLTVSRPAFLMNGNTDTVTFVNNSAVPLTLVFAANPPGGSNDAFFNLPTWPNLVLAANGGSSGALRPQDVYAAVNYTVYANGGMIGDAAGYAIQSGTPAQGSTPALYGPLYVTVNGTTCTPATVVVPLGGFIQFYSTDGLKHTPNWTNAANPFPGLTTVYPQGNSLSQPYHETLPVNTFPYTMGAGFSATGGGGTVKVKPS